jgi:hydrogenase/urease accessory protein HupE
VLLLCSGIADAHGYVRGVNGFYAGFLHPFLAPAHLMALIGLGLLIGQRGIAVGRDAMLAVLAGLVAGLLLSDALGNPDADSMLLGLTALAGIAVASALPLFPRLALAPLAALLGTVVGIGSAPENLHGVAWQLMAGGALLSAFLCINVVAILVESLNKAWMRIGVRVVGSWLTASALLVLALSLAPHRSPASAERAVGSPGSSGLSRADVAQR